eukprot:6725659-Karenia_brevis.AAC.1
MCIRDSTSTSPLHSWETCASNRLHMAVLVPCCPPRRPNVITKARKWLPENSAIQAVAKQASFGPCLCSLVNHTFYCGW